MLMETLFLVSAILFVIGTVSWYFYDQKMETDAAVDQLYHMTHTLEKLIGKADFQVVGTVNNGKHSPAIIGNKYLFYAGGDLYQFKTTKWMGYYHFYLAKFIENTDVGKAKNGNGYFISESKISAPAYIELSRPMSTAQPDRIAKSPAYNYLSELAKNFRNYCTFHEVLKTGPDEKDIPPEYRYDPFDLWA